MRGGTCRGRGEGTGGKGRYAQRSRGGHRGRGKVLTHGGRVEGTGGEGGRRYTRMAGEGEGKADTFMAHKGRKGHFG